jgi:leucyl/phenylalanyl-tRNA--protein transferase
VLGIGADFAPGTMLAAYHQGIFPWPAPDIDVVVWCSPDPRAIFPLDRAPRWSRSLRRSLRKKPFVVTVDRAFAEVVAGCADRAGGTWITDELSGAYAELFRMGWAHSLEVWNSDSGKLVGGIYGIAIGSCFTAESMFHRETDASKVAFASLVDRLRTRFDLFDAEVMNPHLESLGCVEMPRAEFLGRLAEASRRDVEFPRS